MRKIEKAFYGQVVMLRAWCPRCNQQALVLDGVLQCCDRKINVTDCKESKKRHVEGKNKRGIISHKIKNEVLKNQNNQCIYCGANFGEFRLNKKKTRLIRINPNYDHFIPWVYSRDNSASNIVAACSICNGLKSDKYFKTIEQTREYVLDRRIKIGWDKLSDVVDNIVAHSPLFFSGLCLILWVIL